MEQPWIFEDCVWAIVRARDNTTEEHGDGSCHGGGFGSRDKFEGYLCVLVHPGLVPRRYCVRVDAMEHRLEGDDRWSFEHQRR